MLRITVHRVGSQVRLELAGRLGGPWVDETENVWRSGTCAGKAVEVDMREVTGVDNAGRELLAAMHHAGARLVGRGVEMTALIEQITGMQSLDDTNGRSRTRRKH